MALVVGTTPPNLVVETKVKRRAKRNILEDKPTFCDSFWACLLNDYLDDYVEDTEQTHVERELIPSSRRERKKNRRRKRSKRSHRKRLHDLSAKRKAETRIKVDNEEEDVEDEATVSTLGSRDRATNIADEANSEGSRALERTDEAPKEDTESGHLKLESIEGKVDEDRSIGESFGKEVEKSEMSSKSNEVDDITVDDDAETRDKKDIDQVDLDEGDGEEDSAVETAEEERLDEATKEDASDHSGRASENIRRELLDALDKSIKRSRSSKREQIENTVLSRDESEVAKPAKVQSPLIREDEAAKKSIETNPTTSMKEVFEYAPLHTEDSSESEKEGRNDSPHRSMAENEAAAPDVTLAAPEVTLAAPEVTPTAEVKNSSSREKLDGVEELFTGSDPLTRRLEDKKFFPSTVKSINQIPPEVTIPTSLSIPKSKKSKVRKSAPPKRRIPVDPDEEKSALAGIRSMTSGFRQRNDGGDRQAEDNAAGVGGQGTPEDPIEITSSALFRRRDRKDREESELLTKAPGKSRIEGNEVIERNVPDSNAVEAEGYSSYENLEEKDYRRRKLDRKEALHRIRAIKARLASVDP